MCYEGEDVPQDKSEAMGWIRKATEQGNSTGQTNLGAMYSTGELRDQQASVK